VSPTLANFLFEAANLLVLALALGWAFFKPVRRVLDAEVDRHAKQDEDAAQRKAEAEALMEQARTARAEAARERDEQRQQMLEAARREAAGVLDKARATQAAERQALGQEMQAARAAEASALAETVGRIAGASVRDLLERLDGPSLDQALVGAACKALESMPQETRGSAQVESARPLAEESRRQLERALGIHIEERIVPELGAGVRVTTAGGQVDTTASAIARQAAREVTDAARGTRADSTTHDA